MSARDLIPFQFEGRDIRVVYANGEPLLVAKDVAEALGYEWNGSARIAHVPDEWKGVTSVVTLRGAQEMAVLTEQGLYFFLGRSDKPKALPFQKWIAGDVIPAIRLTGKYALPSLSGAGKLGDLSQALRLTPMAVRAARALGLDQNAAAIGANQLVHKITGQNLLKEFGSVHLVAEHQDTQWFTPTELSAQAKLSAVKLNQLLASAGFQVRRGKVWELLDAGRPFARLFDTGKKHNSGVPVQQVKWSPAVIEAARRAGGSGAQLEIC